MALANQKLDQVIADLEQRLEDAKRLKEIAGRRPDLIDAMTGSNHVTTRKRKSTAGPTAWDRIVAYFESQDNAEATMEDIMKATKVTRVMVGEQFYRRHSDEVQSRKDGKTAYWKLKR